MRYRLRRLPRLPEDEVAPQGDLPAPPNRMAHRWLKHGWTAHHLPAGQVQAILDEDLHGLDDEFVALRLMARGLIELMELDPDSADQADLGEAYTLAAVRLSEIIRAEQQAAQAQPRDPEREKLIEYVVHQIDTRLVERGLPLLSEHIQTQVNGSAGDQLLEHRLQEEIAAARLVIRNTLRLGERAFEQHQVREYLRLTNVCGMACSRLARLLQRSQAGQRRWYDVAFHCIQSAAERAGREISAAYEAAAKDGDQ